ncbi:hypothetical protein IAU60_004942 [Kwoniella sp. DSM 27419]
MQLFNFLPVLALLAVAPSALSTETHNPPHRRHLARHVDHARAVERLATVVERQASSEPMRRRKVKINRRGKACRPRSTDAASATETSPVATYAEPSSDSNGDDGYATASTTATDAYPTAAATSGSNDDDESTASATATISSTASSAATSAAGSNNTTSSGGSANGQYTPNGIKAGIAGGDAYDAVKDHIGWWYDWSADPSGHSGKPIAVPMLWGAGGVDATDASRLAVFEAITTAPEYVMAFEEPDCDTQGSANVAVAAGAALWNTLIGPKKARGSTLISPSMCHQAEEEYSPWLSPFGEQITVPWDITAIHVNKLDMAGVKKDIDHYWNKWGKPIWVTEFACVNDVGTFEPSTDQGQIDTFINEIVDLFESDDRVHAYAYSNGAGLDNVWPMWKDGALSASGQTYLNAISKYH